ncbi:MAG: hypothetical protein AB7E85_06830 [Pseudobdellovibrionaceae bacterium]
MSNEPAKKTGLGIMVLVLMVIAFAGGFYYMQQKDKETLFDFNIGGENISATVEQN